MAERTEPPVSKYELTLKITGNSHEELERELLSMTRGGYLLDSEYHTRDEFKVVGGNGTRILMHTNPGMTPERYAVELDEWWEQRKATPVPHPAATDPSDPRPEATRPVAGEESS